MKTLAIPTDLEQGVARPAEVWLWHGAGLGLAVVLGSLAAWGRPTFWQEPHHLVLAVLVAVAYGAALTVGERIRQLPQVRMVGLVLVTVSLCFLAVVAIVALARLYYSRSFLGTAYGVTLVSQVMAYQRQRRRSVRLAVLPGGIAQDLVQLPGITWVSLEAPHWPAGRGLDGVVADLHLPRLGEWVRLLANCRLRGIPVYHAALLWETLTGRLSLVHLREGALELTPPTVYPRLKRVWEALLVLATIPLTLPLILVVALLVRWDSAGPILFWQQRIGQGGRPFWMVKFRSMVPDSEVNGVRFASRQDRRVTRLGRILRHYRLDELPQLWHVLEGKMALIGPRPEQVTFAQQYETELPFYMCRHLVKPGITGWAQVNQGYAAGADETALKLEYDLYYVKYQSLWLDGLIVFKTLKTILTGFGAR